MLLSFFFTTFHFLILEENILKSFWVVKLKTEKPIFLRLILTNFL